MAVEDTTYSATMAWIEDVVALHPELWNHRYEFSTDRGMLWVLMLTMPFPYIANEAGWTVAEVGRQPWIVYGLQRVAHATSTNVTTGMTYFTLLGFMGLYLVLGILYLLLFAHIVNQGPGDVERVHA